MASLVKWVPANKTAPTAKITTGPVSARRANLETVARYDDIFCGVGVVIFCSEEGNHDDP